MAALLEALRPKLPRWLLTSPIAHRGLHDATRPENTMAAFEAAAQVGYPIELDVHLSRDGTVVVFHDETLERLTEQGGRLADLDWEELRTLRVGGTPETIPSLQHVLEVVGTRVPVVIEVKNTSRAGALERAVADVLRDAPGDYTVQSFNPWTLRWFRQHAPKFPRGMLSCDFVEENLPKHEKVALENLVLAPVVMPAYVGYELRCLPHPAPTLLRKLGIPLIAWTIRTEQDLQRAHRLADNVIFENVRP